MSDTSSVRIGNNSDYKDSASIYNEVSFIYFLISIIVTATWVDPFLK